MSQPDVYEVTHSPHAHLSLPVPQCWKLCELTVERVMNPYRRCGCFWLARGSRVSSPPSQAVGRKIKADLMGGNAVVMFAYGSA
eukprot:3462355-Amphidinium_carterae.1